MAEGFKCAGAVGARDEGARVGGAWDGGGWNGAEVGVDKGGGGGDDGGGWRWFRPGGASWREVRGTFEKECGYKCQ